MKPTDGRRSKTYDYEAKYDPGAEAQKLVDDWLDFTKGHPETMHLMQLRLLIVFALDTAYTAGKRGRPLVTR